MKIKLDYHQLKTILAPHYDTTPDAIESIEIHDTPEAVIEPVHTCLAGCRCRRKEDKSVE